ncbi:hypothetical protein [Microbacterium binotii]|uniref:DUF559 domain-containing protein n=1 Tax=Microbacterium binotii TaxID=462710 RepID=A0ABN3P766_9MICO
MSGDIPYELGPAFRVGAARKLGVSEAALRAADLLRPFHGVRAKERELPAQWRGGLLGVHEARHIGRALDFATQMGAHEFFSHATAAFLLGLPLPPRLVRDDEVHVGVLAPRRPPGASDIERYERLAAAGWLVIRATKQDVFEQSGRLMARVRRALASRG